MQVKKLTFSPFRPAADQQPEFAEFVAEKEKYASSRLTGKEKSVRSSIRDKFSSHTPSLELVMKASLVPVLTVGEPFTLFVCMEVGQLSDPKATSVPSVKLKIKELRLYEFTRFRALRVTRGYRHPENEETEEDKTVLNAIPEVRVVEQQLAPPPAYQPATSADDSKETKRPPSSSSSSSTSSSASRMQWAPDLIFPTTFEARIPSDVVPSFRTVTINHHFVLKVEVEVEIAGKEFEHEFYVSDLTILPQADAGRGWVDEDEVDGGGEQITQ